MPERLSLTPELMPPMLLLSAGWCDGSGAYGLFLSSSKQDNCTPSRLVGLQSSVADYSTQRSIALALGCSPGQLGGWMVSF
jgi:hypothetical protein